MAPSICWKQQRYWVALFNRGGERAGVERELAREPRLEVARARYNERYPAGSANLVMLATAPRCWRGAIETYDASGRMSSEAILS